MKKEINNNNNNNKFFLVFDEEDDNIYYIVGRGADIRWAYAYLTKYSGYYYPLYSGAPKLRSDKQYMICLSELGQGAFSVMRLDEDDIVLMSSLPQFHTAEDIFGCMPLQAYRRISVNRKGGRNKYSRRRIA